MAIYLKKTIELLNRQIDFVLLQIQMEQNTAICPLLRTSLKSGSLQWTGTQVEFVEFVYSLRDAKSVNSGNISLKELFTVLGEFFNIKITDYYRFYGDITHRTGDRTLYLDKLKKAFMQHLSESDNRQR